MPHRSIESSYTERTPLGVNRLRPSSNDFLAGRHIPNLPLEHQCAIQRSEFERVVRAVQNEKELLEGSQSAALNQNETAASTDLESQVVSLTVRFISCHRSLPRRVPPALMKDRDV